MEPEKEIQKIYAAIFKNVDNKKWPCLFSGCEGESINSHLLQQNGILDAIAEEGHLYEMRSTDFFKWKTDSNFLEFSKVGIKKSISHPLFCNKHDTGLFKEVESSAKDFNSYKNHVLLSYRAVCAEARKKQRNIETHTRLLNSNVLRSLISRQHREYLELFLAGTRLGLVDLTNYKLLFESEMQEVKNHFTFRVFEFPLIKVYGSATFSPIYETTDPMQQEQFSALFIHVVPYNKKLFVIIGYHNSFTDDWIKNYLVSWEGLNLNALQIKLTDLFSTKIETWGMAPSIYKNIKKETLAKFLRYWKENADNLSPNQFVNYNLFE